MYKSYTMNQLKSGFLLINKPAGITSFGCIKQIKRIIRQKIKIGHAGTLDPFATGLLIIAIGREATRMMPHIMTLEKTYIAKAKMGELTDTLDLTGTIIETKESKPISEKEILQALQSFGSAYEQIPPLYSALKHKGDPLYKLTREQKLSTEELLTITQQKKKLVHLYELELLSFEFPFFTIKARVSHGTYIRSLINDIATKLNSYATTYTLERTAIGKYSLEKATNLADIQTIEDIERNIINEP